MGDNLINKMLDNLIEIQKELEKNIVMLQAIDKVSKRDDALVLDGKVQALQWVLDVFKK